MIRNFVFDMGGVLMRFDPERAVRPYAQSEEDAELLKTVIFDSDEWLKLDAGAIEEEEALKAWLSRFPERLWDACRAVFANWHRHMPFDDGMTFFVGALRACGYRIFLLSNVSKRFYAFRDDTPVFSLMDGLFLSCDYHLLKPDPAIFKKFTEVYGLKAEECFFIDDSERNVRSAAGAGFAAFRYTGDGEALQREMKNRGIEFSGR